MLLITDRSDESRDVARGLALLGHCAVVALDGQGKGQGERAVAQPRIVVSDVDLGERRSVEAIREALTRHRRKDMPYLCLLRDMTARSTIQARAIGATEILPAGAAPSVLVKTISQLLQEGEDADPARGTQAFTRAHLATAAVSLADMLQSASSGKAIPLAAVEASVDAIDQAAGAADIGDWLQVVWSYDDLTYQHCMLVAGLAASFAHRLGFGEDDRRLVTRAAVLHDIGKARIPLDILHKPGALDEAEQAVMRSHPVVGHQMLVAQGGIRPEVLAAVRSHHEYLDGTGYPDGLRGHEISDIVRMITICDIYAALIERRSYKLPLLPDQAYDLLVLMGAKLDADLVRAFGDVVLKPAQAA
ncbi:MAG TPA: HD domain-containing phosphohydrolase [Bosea sp. (in: a-proteobacteria)]|jgi:putative nucleotidyltransferase with HDIG domain|uniref:HD-GYP domain-containing protein n=1 Tax=Bosea sp. (in: a-proteobacteria) TaxID=1871050 RepID=UPI002E0E2C2C|nr:HD domain-containing phosphohydrolase [Bosea sp. (in: a-proteobacteria)]